MPFKIVRNDITKMATEAIVNTANEKPTVGTGCDFAVYNAAGYDELLSWRKKYIGTVPEGDAFITPGFRLPAKYIIHAVSPLYIDGNHGEEELLRSCYRKSLALAAGHGIRSIAFPLISTGGFGYPKEEGMRIAVDEIHAFLLKSDMQIFLVVFGERATRMGKSLYPDLEAYIDRNYVQEKRIEEYGDAYVAAHEDREEVSPQEYYSRRGREEVPYQAYYGAAGIREDASNQAKHTGSGDLREKGDERRKPGILGRLRAARRKDAAKENALPPSIAGSAEFKESLPPPSAARPPYSEDADLGATYSDGAYFRPPCSEEASPEEAYESYSEEASPEEAHESYEEGNLYEEDAVLELERRLAERIAHMSDTFPEYLLYLIRKNGMDNADVYKRAIVDKKVFSKIKNNPEYHPKKLTALCLCVGARLNIDETRDLLARAGYALSPCDKTDIIFSYFIEHGIYDMIELDIQLEEHGLPCIIA